MKKNLGIIALFSIVLLSFLFSACSSPESGKEGFAIYLTRDNIPVDKMEMQSHIEIAKTPLISGNDIEFYDWDKHEFELTTKAWGELNSLKVPTNGTAFVVCVDKAPVYWGAFWNPVSSQSFSGVTILVPSISVVDDMVRIVLGYPSSSFFRGEDPRSNQEIMASLKAAGKLK